MSMFHGRLLRRRSGVRNLFRRETKKCFIEGGGYGYREWHWNGYPGEARYNIVHLSDLQSQETDISIQLVCNV